MSCIIGSFLCCHLLYLIIYLIIPKVEVYSYESDYDSHSCKMLGIFPNDFSQVATSQGYFPKWQLLKCAISQAATSQVCSSRSTFKVQSSAPNCSLWCLREPNLTFGKLHIWGVATWENTLGKLLLRKKVPNTCRNCFFPLNC